MDYVFSQLCLQKRIDWNQDKFVNSFLHISPTISEKQESKDGELTSSLSNLSSSINDVNIVLNLESLLSILSKYDHSYTLYAIAHGIRRLSVLLKCTNRLRHAFTAIQTAVHLFQVIIFV
jgi:2-keto-4-pentenoate hydratase/2-oxohepta-3-ene-1,7-dioic acid hydratase in catechol pathway